MFHFSHKLLHNIISYFNFDISISLAYIFVLSYLTYILPVIFKKSGIVHTKIIQILLKDFTKTMISEISSQLCIIYNIKQGLATFADPCAGPSSSTLRWCQWPNHGKKPPGVAPPGSLTSLFTSSISLY
uniref:Uncharacterized protein n=1 Tax=Pelusios castaneus TaxID=367368 RepID=A0A8C8R999_9SAUR